MNDGSKLASEASADWGKFQLWVRAHPLTAWWVGLLCGGALGWVAKALHG